MNIRLFNKTTRGNSFRSRESGFTLLEIAVVLVIIAITLSLLLPSITGRITTVRLEATRGKEELIKTALIAFVAQKSN